MILGEYMKHDVHAGRYGAVLPNNSSLTKLVHKVVDRVAEANGISNHFEVYVVANSQANAFVAPGGTIVVFQGLFEILQSQDELALIIAHELGHFMARHTAESLTLSGVLLGFQQFLGALLPFPFFDTIEQSFAKLAFKLPHSRHMESEADFIGLKLMAKACFDPRCAPTVLARLGQSSTEWLSTHPSSELRISQVNESMPAALDVYKKSRCLTQKTGFLAWVRGLRRDS
eukprot:c4354_g1_i3.p1 GENE.c4354_g1_i3~~c4354_g1_i3.p1  ORF type:complete len:230 (+),score=27.56 c4354_g1_i3:305-994(+)